MNTVLNWLLWAFVVLGSLVSILSFLSSMILYGQYRDLGKDHSLNVFRKFFEYETACMLWSVPALILLLGIHSPLAWIVEFKVDKDPEWKYRLWCTVHLNKLFRAISKPTDRLLEYRDNPLGVVMAITAKKSKPVKYVMCSERDDSVPEHEKASVSMRILPREFIAQHRDRRIRFKKGQVNALRSNFVALDLVRQQIVGWQNMFYEDENGETRELVFDAENLEELYEKLPSVVQDELEAVFGDGTFSKEAEKRWMESLEDEEDDDDDEEISLDED
tara:strand:+ start:16538 stop:17362 length:825 start_codon:yes stop_codon:yes gene_type:complete